MSTTSLLLFGVLQAASNLGFWWLAVSGKGLMPGLVLPAFDWGFVQLAQPTHSICVPLRMSIPVGQTWTQMPQSTQSPRPRARGSLPLGRAPRDSPRTVS